MPDIRVNRISEYTHPDTRLPTLRKAPPIDGGTRIYMDFLDPLTHADLTVPATVGNNTDYRNLNDDANRFRQAGAINVDTAGIVFSTEANRYINLDYLLHGAAKFPADCKAFGVGGWFTLTEPSSVTQYTSIVSWQLNTTPGNSQYLIQRNRDNPGQLIFGAGDARATVNGLPLDEPMHVMTVGEVDGTSITCTAYISGEAVAVGQAALATGLLPQPVSGVRVGAGGGGYSATAYGGFKAGTVEVQQFDAADSYYSIQDYMKLAHGCLTGRFS